MDSLNNFFQELYKNFNDRKIDLVISKMTDNVKWANGMEGGYVYGHNGVRDYWTRQFTIISSNVTPLEIDTENEVVKIKLHPFLKIITCCCRYQYFIWCCKTTGIVCSPSSLES